MDLLLPAGPAGLGTALAGYRPWARPLLRLLVLPGAVERVA